MSLGRPSPQPQVAPFSFLECRPIGVMGMLDQGEQDDKIIAVHIHGALRLWHQSCHPGLALSES